MRNILLCDDDINITNRLFDIVSSFFKRNKIEVNIDVYNDINIALSSIKGVKCESKNTKKE